MNIYTFKHSEGETDWIFAPNITEAENFYLNFTDCSNFNECEVKKLPRNRWNEMYLLDPNEKESHCNGDYNENDYCCGLKIIETFAEYAEKNTVTDIIASTGY